MSQEDKFMMNYEEFKNKVVANFISLLLNRGYSKKLIFKLLITVAE